MTEQTAQQPLETAPGLPPIPPAPDVARDVLWHHMARGSGQTPDPDTIAVLQIIDRELQQGPLPFGLERPVDVRELYPVHYGYMYLARHVQDGLAILESIAKGVDVTGPFIVTSNTVAQIAADTGHSEKDVLALVDQLTELGDSPVLRETENGIFLDPEAADVIRRQLAEGNDRG